MTETVDAATPRPFGGWLILIAIGLIIAPIRLIVAWIPIISPLFETDVFAQLTSPVSPYYHPLWKPLLYGEILGNTFVLLLGLLLIILFAQKRRAFPKWFAIRSAIYVIFILADALTYSQIDPASPIFDTQSMKVLAASLIGLCIWSPYLFYSRRSKETFLK